MTTEYYLTEVSNNEYDTTEFIDCVENDRLVKCYRKESSDSSYSECPLDNGYFETLSYKKYNEMYDDTIVSLIKISDADVLMRLLK